MSSENPYRTPQVPAATERGHAEGHGLLWCLFSFRGRIPRRYYWFGMLGLVAAEIAGILITACLDAMQVEVSDAAICAIVWPLLIPFFWIDMALHIKRLHDRGYSAWWMLIAILIPVVGLIWLCVQVGFLRGTVGPNRFGEDRT